MGALINEKEFDFSSDKLWIMHCAVGPVPKVSCRAGERVLQKELRPWDMSLETDFFGIPAQLREQTGFMLGVGSEDITLTPNTSSGLCLIAQAYPWKGGDEVLAPLGEFPSNAWPWMALERRGVHFREVPLWPGHRSGQAAFESIPPTASADAEDALIEAIGERTRVLAVSWVRFQDGLKLDLTRLARRCRAHNVHVVVDGIQGAGTCATDLRGVSAFVAGGHKGLLGLSGQGFVYTQPEFRQHLLPAGSWLSVEDAGDFSRPSTDFSRNWRLDGQRLEQGNYNVLGCAVLATSMSLLNSVGVARIAHHVRNLQRQLVDGLTRIDEWQQEAARLSDLLDADRLGSMICLHHRGHGPAFLDKALRQAYGSQIFATAREGYLRIALHGWHDENDVARILGWLADVTP